MQENFHLERASLLLNQGRVEDAMIEIRQLLSIEPRNDAALGLLGRCYFEKDQFLKGIECVEDAISIAPNEGYYFYLLSFAFYKQHQIPQAIQYIQQAISLQPYAAEYFGLHAMILIDKRDFEKALEKADEGLMLQPDSILLLNARSMALNKLKKVDEAIETMQFALAQDPENAYTHQVVGWNLLEKGNHKPAALHFREALRLNPMLDGAREGLKESLKSIIPPYKWLLRYNFWIHNQGKNARWIVPIALYLMVRAISAFSGGNKAGNNIGLIVSLGYVIFVFSTWLIPHFANFFLLYHQDGKYALNRTEKNNAISLVYGILIASLFFLMSFVLNSNISSNVFIFSALGILGVALSSTYIQYPIRFTKRNWHASISFILCIIALIGVLLCWINLNTAYLVLSVFFVGFILHNWLGLFK